MPSVLQQLLSSLTLSRKIQLKDSKSSLPSHLHFHDYFQIWTNHLTQPLEKHFRLKLQVDYILPNKQVIIHLNHHFTLKEKDMYYMEPYNLGLILELTLQRDISMEIFM